MLIGHLSCPRTVQLRQFVLLLPSLPLQGRMLGANVVPFLEGASLRADDLQQLVAVLRSDKAFGSLQNEITRGNANLAALFGCGARLVEASAVA